MAACPSVITADNIDGLDAHQLRELVTRLRADVLHKQTLIDKLTHENAVLKRLKFAAQSELFHAEQRSLLEEALDGDLRAVSEEIERLAPQDKPAGETNKPKRQPLPAEFPRREIRLEPESTLCSCGCQMKRIGEDVAEKLDYQPGVFTVERHVRGKWACAKCEKLVQAPVPPHVIDKGVPTSGLLAQVLVAKFAITCRCTGRKRIPKSVESRCAIKASNVQGGLSPCHGSIGVRGRCCLGRSYTHVSP